MGDRRLKIQYQQLRLAFMTEGRGETPDAGQEGTESPTAKREPENPATGESLMEEVCERENLEEAWHQVRSNQGSPGVDGRTIDETRDYLREHWPTIREQLLKGTYRPQPVRRVEIAKPDGGVRKLGIPTVLDSLIQQAILQVLQRRWDPTFSEHSYGFRPGRSAHQAVAQAQSYVAEGYEWVVDIDLEKFFDRVNHDILMDRVARRISDKGAPENKLTVSDYNRLTYFVVSSTRVSPSWRRRMTAGLRTSAPAPSAANTPRGMSPNNTPP